MKPTYFDLSVRDLGAARRFFEASLGWRFEVAELRGRRISWVRVTREGGPGAGPT